MNKLITMMCATLLLANHAAAAELIIGKETVAPGIVFIFEGAVKDDVTPAARHLAEDETHVHLEALANWGAKSIPAGAPAGGFVPHLTITAKVVNAKTGAVLMTDLLAHVNLIDGFHDARNIALPGAVSDRYHVIFHVAPPTGLALALHRDWREKYGDRLLAERTFRYDDIDFSEIAAATRR